MTKLRIADYGLRICQAPFAEAGQTGENPKSEIRNPKSRESGYTLVVLLMAIAVMAIMMGVALQTVQFQMQREREAELIFRGQQYVEGIRLYKKKYGRHPMRMKELWEANPRVLRQKWTDPINGTEEWGVVFLGQEGARAGGRRPPEGARRPTPTPTPVFSREREGGGEKVGPIVGVHSLATGDSIKIYEGRTRYSEWLFVLKEDEQQRGARPGGGRGQTGGTPWGQHPGMPTPEPPKPTGTPGY